MTPLGQILAAEILANGPMPVDAWMSACLAHPEHGYYMSQQPFGRGGDFITAPEISQCFGELLGLWIAAAWDQAGRPTPALLVEIGPGRGVLMSDALRAMAMALPAARTALQPVLIETSPALRAVQQQALAGQGVQWLDTVTDLPDWPLFIIANELLDALPSRQFIATESGWAERAVTWSEEHGFGWSSLPLADPPDLAPEPLGAIVESSPARIELIRSLAERLNGGAALLIDYGTLSGLQIGDSLQAVRAHAFACPLAEPGRADLTTHVDFASLAAAVPGLAWGPITQRSLLLRLGLMPRVQRLAAGKDRATVAALESATQRLIATDGMGTLFKCLALSAGTLPPPGLTFEERFTP